MCMSINIDSFAFNKPNAMKLMGALSNKLINNQLIIKPLSLHKYFN